MHAQIMRVRWSAGTAVVVVHNYVFAKFGLQAPGAILSGGMLKGCTCQRCTHLTTRCKGVKDERPRNQQQCTHATPHVNISG